MGGTHGIQKETTKKIKDEPIHNRLSVWSRVNVIANASRL
jgi:hypothetical protein